MKKAFTFMTAIICALMLACGGSDVPANVTSEAGDAAEEQTSGQEDGTTGGQSGEGTSGQEEEGITGGQSGEGTAGQEDGTGEGTSGQEDGTTGGQSGEGTSGQEDGTGEGTSGQEDGTGGQSGEGTAGQEEKEGSTGDEGGTTGTDGTDTVVFDTYTFVYKKYAGYNLKIAFDIPRKRAAENTPFILWVTGGGWSKANINSFARHSEEFARKGIAGVRINYSVMDQGGNLQMGYDEVEAAYDFIRSKASEYSLDTLSFGFGAGSAGTTLASYHALKMKGCKVYIGCNGMYDLNTRYETSSFPGASCKYLKPYTEAQKRAMSPINNIGDHLPAVIMFHGDADVTINYRQSTAFEAALKAHGGTAVTHIYPGQVHAFFNYGKSEWDVDVTTRMMDFAIPRLLAPVSD